MMKNVVSRHCQNKTKKDFIIWVFRFPLEAQCTLLIRDPTEAPRKSSFSLFCIKKNVILISGKPKTHNVNRYGMWKLMRWKIFKNLETKKIKQNGKSKRKFYVSLFSVNKSLRELPAVFCERSEAIWITQGLPGEISPTRRPSFLYSNISIRATSEESHSSTRGGRQAYEFLSRFYFPSSANRATLTHIILGKGLDI